MAHGGSSTKGEALSGVIPQPTLPKVDIDEDDLWKAKRKADRAGIDIPSQRRAPSPLTPDNGLYPGRQSLPSNLRTSR